MFQRYLYVIVVAIPLYRLSILLSRPWIFLFLKVLFDNEEACQLFSICNSKLLQSFKDRHVLHLV